MLDINYSKNLESNNFSSIKLNKVLTNNFIELENHRDLHK